MDKKGVLIIGVIILIVIISYYFWQESDKEKIEENCVEEGEMISTMPLSDQNAEPYKCCKGLTEILVEPNMVDVAYCTNCGDGICKEPEADFNCLEDCS